MAKKQEEILEEDSLLEDKPRVYEFGFHLDPELPSEEVKKAYSALHDSIAEQGTIIAEGEPEKIQLAYTISRQETAGRRDFNSAFFCWIAYETLAQKHEAILTVAKAEKRIIRFIDLVTTKEAVQHASDLRELSLREAESSEKEGEDEDTTDAALDAALEKAAV